MRSVATVPGGAGSTVYGTPALARAAVAMSQELVNFFLPIGSNWKLQVSGSATTTAGELTLASPMAGLA